MKHISIILIFVVISIPSFGQLFFGKVEINKSDTIKVIEVLITEKMSNKYVDVYVDFGQKSNSGPVARIMIPTATRIAVRAVINGNPKVRWNTIDDFENNKAEVIRIDDRFGK